MPDLSALRRHAIFNVENGSYLVNEDGSISTVRSGSVEDERLNGGRPTLIPFVWDGRVADPDEAIEFAVKSGVEWPAFDTNEAATAASKSVSEDVGLALERFHAKRLRKNRKWDELRKAAGLPPKGK